MGIEMLDMQKKIKLKVGSHSRLEGFVHVDIDPKAQPDIIADIQHMPQIKTNSVDEIVCEYVLEHIVDVLKVMFEFHRVLKPGGRLKIVVPHANNPGFWGTPDHIHGFNYTTFNQFWQTEGAHRGYPKFKCVKRRLVLHKKSLQFMADRWPVQLEYLYAVPFLWPDYIVAELKAIK